MIKINGYLNVLEITETHFPVSYLRIHILLTENILKMLMCSSSRWCLIAL